MLEGYYIREGSSLGLGQETAVIGFQRVICSEPQGPLVDRELRVGV